MSDYESSTDEQQDPHQRFASAGQAILNRMQGFWDSGNPDVLFGEDADRDLARLRQYLDSPEADGTTDVVLQNQRSIMVLQLTGHLLYHRSTQLPRGPHLVVLAQAIENLLPLADRAELLPPGLHRLLGPTAHPLAQALTAHQLVSATMSTGDPAPLSAAIELFTLALAALPHDDSFRPGWLRSLSQAYVVRVELGGASDVDAARTEGGGLPRAVPADLDRAVEAAEQALELFNEHSADAGEASDDADRTSRPTSRLTRALAVPRTLSGPKRWRRAGKPEVDESDEADLWRYLSCLRSAYLARYEAGGRKEDLSRSIELGRQELALLPYDRLAPATQSRLARALRASYQADHDVEALIEAVGLQRASLAERGDGHSTSAGGMAELGVMLRILGVHTGDAVVLAEAVSVGRTAVDAVPEGGPSRAGFLADLGDALLAEYQCTGTADILRDALKVCREATDAGSPWPSEQARCLSTLGTALRLEYEATGRGESLIEAVNVAEAAVDATSANDSNRATFLSNLGLTLDAYFEYSGDPELLDEAVAAHRRAVTAGTADSFEHAGRLNNLGKILHKRFESTYELSTLIEAVGAYRNAVAALPKNHADRVFILANLGGALDALADRTGSAGMRAESVRTHRAVLATATADDPRRADYLTSLGSALLGSYASTRNADLLRDAKRCYAEVSGNRAVRAVLRIRAYRAIAEAVLVHEADPAQALAAMEAAVALLPLLVASRADRLDREAALARLPSLGGLAVAAAVRAGNPERAVQLLELTRGVLASATLAGRESEFSRLRARNAALADDLAGAARSADRLGGAASGAPERPAGNDDERDVYTRWDDTLARVQAEEGFAEFLRPPTVDQLVAAGREGHVVFVTVSSAGSHALILTGDERRPVESVPLSGLTMVGAFKQAGRLMKARTAAGDSDTAEEERAAAQAEVHRVLGWLWDVVAEPVLGALGATHAPAPDRMWPRVWWCPVGIMNQFPLHAAGHHEDLVGAPDPSPRIGPPRTAMDRVVSSYTTTLRGLVHARAHRAAESEARTVVIAVPDAPGLPMLQGVAREADYLVQKVPHAHLLRNPTWQTVIEALPHYAIAHFACHGFADWTDPGSSRLVLGDYATSPLTVTDINALNLDADLVFLSACETSGADLRLADEAVHLTGAFHLAGYRYVVGTLWPVLDVAAERIAKAFYAHLTDSGSTMPDASRSPVALHRAVRAARADFPDQPTFWAAHIQAGA